LLGYLITMPESRVSLATRSDIFRLVAFLDHFLPEENDVKCSFNITLNRFLLTNYLFSDSFVCIIDSVGEGIISAGVFYRIARCC